jgi:hypothetical protein
MFSNKFIEELSNIEQICILTNNATETEWYQQMIKSCSCVCFLKSRVKFIDVNGNESGAPLQGQSIMYFGDRSKNFIKEFNNYGICLMRIEVV